MNSLAPILPKLSPLILMLDSDSDGEALNALRALRRRLRADGFDFHDIVAAIEPRHPVRCGSAGQNHHRHERPVWSHLPTEGRLIWLRAIHDVSEPSTWQHDFTANIERLISAGRLLTPKQSAAAHSLLVDAWNRGLRI